MPRVCANLHFQRRRRNLYLIHRPSRSCTSRARFCKCLGAGGTSPYSVNFRNLIKIKFINSFRPKLIEYSRHLIRMQHFRSRITAPMSFLDRRCVSVVLLRAVDFEHRHVVPRHVRRRKEDFRERYKEDVAVAAPQRPDAMQDFLDLFESLLTRLSFLLTGVEVTRAL
jgi:hypothetical protein